MADGTVRQGRMRRGLSRRGLAPLLAPLAAALGAAPAKASVLEHAAELLRLDPHNALGLSLLLGLTIFPTTTALLPPHQATRRPWGSPSPRPRRRCSPGTSPPAGAAASAPSTARSQACAAPTIAP